MRKESDDTLRRAEEAWKGFDVYVPKKDYCHECGSYGDHEAFIAAYAAGAAEARKEHDNNCENFRVCEGEGCDEETGKGRMEWVLCNKCVNKREKALDEARNALVKADEGDGVTAAFVNLVDEHSQLQLKVRPLVEALKATRRLVERMDWSIEPVKPTLMLIDAALRAAGEDK